VARGSVPQYYRGAINAATKLKEVEIPAELKQRLLPSSGTAAFTTTRA